MACYVSAATAQQSLPPLKGRSLQEALRILQREGLRIVFSSEAVTADMRVREAGEHSLTNCSNRTA